MSQRSKKDRGGSRKTFSLKERWAKGGIGSSKLVIGQSSMDIHNLLVLDNNRNTCNIELRPKGIILRFRSLLETYALVIPTTNSPYTKEKHRNILFIKTNSL